MPLSSEDSLRLNVLLAGRLDAVRIDESRMIVYGLKGGQEAKIQLNPNCKDEAYLKQVRELLSGHVLGSPGGYPVYLKRWTRMGQARDESLADLLKLGEPEAVMAVVCAPGLTNGLARLAWWVAPEAEHARRMLERDTIVKGDMGKELANFLVEFLPFEEDPLAIVHSVSLVLQEDLIDADMRQSIWDRGRAKNVFRIGFLNTLPHDLPDAVAPREDLGKYRDVLNAQSSDNIYAGTLLSVLSQQGQTFLDVCETILHKPANQEVVSALLNSLGKYFRPHERDPEHLQDIAVLEQRASESLSDDNSTAAMLLRVVPELEKELKAVIVLSQVTEAIVTPVFARSDAIGTVMRRQLEPITSRLFEQFAVLRGRITG